MAQNESHTSEVSYDYDYYQNHNERRIILIGKSGTGKSTIGNAILGEKKFEIKIDHMHSNPLRCEAAHCKTKDGKDIVVVDTAGLMDTKRRKEKIIVELCKCTAMIAPGPHAFCFVISSNQKFTRESLDALNTFSTFFGEEIYKYLIVVFTHKAGMGKRVTTDDCLRDLPDGFQEKLSKYGSKKIAIEFTNKHEPLKNHIKTLFALIEEIIKQNNGGCYTDGKLKSAEETFRKREHNIHKELEKKFKAKETSLKVEYQEKVKRLDDQENACLKAIQDANLEQTKQLKEYEKKELERNIYNLKKEIKKEQKKRKKMKQRYRQEMNDLTDDVAQQLRNVRENIRESQGFREVVRNMVMAQAWQALSPVTGYICNLIETFFRKFL